MSAKNEAGQWKAIKWSCHARTTVVVDDESVVTGKRVIAECETEDDARLIAAAPETAAERDSLKEINAELLAALTSLRDAFIGTSVEVQADAMRAARAAIAKAKGGAA